MSTQQLILVALFAALTALLSQLSVPLPSGVPATLQTFAIALCGFVLGTRQGALAVLVYLLLGAVGLPVFAGFSGGVTVFVDVTGGFLWGFFALAALCGTRKLVWGAAGLILCHVMGVAQFSLVARSSLLNSFVVASLPFLIKDAGSLLLAWVVSRAVNRGLAAAHFMAS